MSQTISDNGVTYGNTAAANQLYSVGATIGSNALTVTLDPTTIAFRSTTLTTGTPTVVQNAAQLSLTVPSGATLGSVSAFQSDVAIIAINNAGTMELGVCIGAPDESTTINTTAISAASGTIGTVYTASARTGVAFKVVGYVRSTQATAGTWATALTSVYGTTPNSFQSIGYGQTWQLVTRTSGTTYYNTTGKPLFCSYSFGNGSSGAFAVTVNGVANISNGNNAAGLFTAASFIVPPGGSYSYTYSFATANTYELR